MDVDRVLREVTKETSAAGIWMKLSSLYMTKSLANRLYLKKKLYTYYMSTESLTMEDVLMTLNSRELKKRTEDTKEETGDGLYDHLKRDCPKKKSSGFVKKGKRDQDSDSSDDDGNAYFGEALMVVGNDEMTELVMDSGWSYHMTHKRNFLYDFKVVDGGSVQLGDNKTCTIKGTRKVKIQLHDGSSFILEDVRYVPRLRRSLISLGTLEKDGYTVKKFEIISVPIDDDKYTIIWFDVMNEEFRTIDPPRQRLSIGWRDEFVNINGEVGFVSRNCDIHEVWVLKQEEWVMDREVEVFQVSNDDTAVAQRWLEDKQPGEKTNTDYLIKEQEKVHLGIKVGENITVTRVPGQEGVEGNVAEKKKVKESMKANLRKLLKYNAWSTRWSPVRGSSMRKRC
ncbi:zinc finger, CCHC-type containing protein [Tanacetum coccineum]